MEKGQWGHCKHCRYFTSPAAQPLGAEEAGCAHPTLGKYELRVYGSNGCRGWQMRATLPSQPATRQPISSMPI